MAEILPDEVDGFPGAYLTQVQTLPNKMAKRDGVDLLFDERDYLPDDRVILPVVRDRDTTSWPHRRPIS